MKPDPDKLARELWTIGDVNRLRILALLPQSSECHRRINVHDIAKKLGMTQPTVSNHLARLRTLGIVRCCRVGRDVFYWIDQDNARQIVCTLGKALKL